MAVFPDRWGVVAAIAGVGAIYGFFGAVGLSDFSITAIKPTLFGTLCIIACIISWKVHRRLKKDQMLSMTERTDAILNASKNEMKNIVAFNDIPLVSTDFNHNPASSIYDSNLTKVMDDRLVKVYVWYDNEWGFSNRMLDVTLALMNAK